MSEEKKEGINQEESDVAKGSDEKGSNKTFTQSEFDSALDREIKKIKSEFGDYEDLKKTTEELLNEKKERELSEKTEVEQLQVKLKDLEDQFTTAQNINKELEVKLLRDNILAKNDYSVLPRAYKNMVGGDTEEDIIQNANDILNEYQEDMKKINPDIEFAPIGTEKKPVSNENKSAMDLIKDKFKKKGAEYGNFRLELDK